jgi:hypothetical protein
MAGDELRITLDIVDEVGEAIAVAWRITERHLLFIELGEFRLGQPERLVTTVTLAVEEHMGERREGTDVIVVAVVMNSIDWIMRRLMM